MNIPAQELVWKDSSADEKSGTRLLARLFVAGCDMHLEAYEVKDGDDGQEETGEEFVGVISGVYAAIGAEGPWEEAEINGRRYVLIATPYCT